MKHFLFLLIFFSLGLNATFSFAQEVTKQVEPGCKFIWKEPMVENPSIPGTQIGAWELAGDLEGFQWVTNNEPVFDALKMQLFPDPTLRELSCLQVDVETPNKYVVMIKAFDDSGNASESISLSFELVLEDTQPPATPEEACLVGVHKGKLVQYCFDTIPIPLVSP